MVHAAVGPGPAGHVAAPRATATCGGWCSRRDLARVGRDARAPGRAAALPRASRIVTLSESSRDELVARARHFTRPRLGRAAGHRSAASPRRRAVGRRRSSSPSAGSCRSSGSTRSIRRWPRVRERVPDTELVDRRRRRRARRPRGRSSRDLDAAEWVRLAGRRRDDELVASTGGRGSWPARRLAEGWGMTITEAAACATPAVVTDIPGHRDAVSHGVTRRRWPTARRASLAREWPRPDRRRPARERLAAGALGHGRPLHLGGHRRRAPSRVLRRARRTAICAAGRLERRRSIAGAWPSHRRPATSPWRRSPTSRCSGASPGQVGADTKTYLYLDPGRLLGQAPYLWDPTVGMGTVTHQTIGYLWPLGPVLLGDGPARRPRLGGRSGSGSERSCSPPAPASCSCGAPRLGRRAWPAVAVAAFAYCLSPYVLDYAARISVILMPWAGLPWLIAFAARAVRGAAWRWPALFALIVLTVGGINATALLLAGLGPALWVPWAVWGARETTVPAGRGRRRPDRPADAGTSRGGSPGSCSRVGTASTSCGTRRPTRPSPTRRRRARGAARPRLLVLLRRRQGRTRGWARAGRTRRTCGSRARLRARRPRPWRRWRRRAASATAATSPLLVFVGRGRRRSAAIPYDAARRSTAACSGASSARTAGQAMRSTPRAVPLVVLALALALGVGAGRLGVVHGAPAALRRGRAGRLPRPPRRRHAAAVDRQGVHAGNLQRGEDIPSYWSTTAPPSTPGAHDTRVYELPGSDFANYRWGGTVDPITPGLTDRPYVARELVP